MTPTTRAAVEDKSEVVPVLTHSRAASSSSTLSTSSGPPTPSMAQYHPRVASSLDGGESRRSLDEAKGIEALHEYLELHSSSGIARRQSYSGAASSSGELEYARLSKAAETSAAPLRSSRRRESRLSQSMSHSQPASIPELEVSPDSAYAPPAPFPAATLRRHSIHLPTPPLNLARSRATFTSVLRPTPAPTPIAPVPVSPSIYSDDEETGAVSELARLLEEQDHSLLDELSTYFTTPLFCAPLFSNLPGPASATSAVANNNYDIVDPLDTVSTSRLARRTSGASYNWI